MLNVACMYDTAAPGHEIVCLFELEGEFDVQFVFVDAHRCVCCFGSFVHEPSHLHIACVQIAIREHKQIDAEDGAEFDRTGFGKMCDLAGEVQM